MKLKVWVSMGREQKDETFDIPDEEIKGMDENERHNFFQSYVDGSINNYVEAGYEEVND